MTVPAEYLRDGREHDLEVRFEARDLFVVEGLPLDKVAERVPASASTVRRWSARGRWERPGVRPVSLRSRGFIDETITLLWAPGWQRRVFRSRR